MAVRYSLWSAFPPAPAGDQLAAALAKQAFCRCRFSSFSSSPCKAKYRLRCIRSLRGSRWNTPVFRLPGNIIFQSLRYDKIRRLAACCFLGTIFSYFPFFFRRVFGYSLLWKYVVKESSSSVIRDVVSRSHPFSP